MFQAARISCPHLQADRTRALVQVQGPRRRDQAMDLCIGCLRCFQALSRGWGRRQLSPAAVVRAVTARGFTRIDALRFLVQLVLTPHAVLLAGTEPVQ